MWSKKSSNNHTSKLTPKELEILKRQRRLAAQFNNNAGGTASGGGGASAGAASSTSKPPPPPPQSSSSSSSKPFFVAGKQGKPAASSSSSNSNTAKGMMKGPPPSVLKSMTSSSASAATAPEAPALKRPSIKRNTIGSAGALAAAARARAAAASSLNAAGSTTSQSEGDNEKDSSASDAAAASNTQKAAPVHQRSSIRKRPKPESLVPSPPLKRKTLAEAAAAGAASGATGSGGGSTLASLVQSLAAADPLNSEDNDREPADLPTITPDDFWKHLRNWDLVSQYYSQIEMQKQQQQQQADAAGQKGSSSSNNNNPSSSTTKQQQQQQQLAGGVGKKPLPNVFLNPRHYIAAWAPLCLAECRAQLLQECMTGNYAPIPVTVETANTGPGGRGGGGRRGGGHGSQDTMMMDGHWLEENETGGHVIVRPQRRGDGGDLSFATHDLCLLLRSDYATVLQDLERNFRVPPPTGRDIGDFSIINMVGHTESARQELNGLILKVSRRKWAQMGQKNMHLLKLGGNITALREFTALCKVDLLPMKRFLLGQHLAPSGGGGGTVGGGRPLRKLSANASATQLLNEMGGSQALGQGFLQYARNKFNASQLAAIAASAMEYGEGGFTCIKGPPGTGKTTTLVAVLNSLHIRQYNKYYEEVRRIAAQPTGSRETALQMARKSKPRLLVCAPSNAAVDNIILKIMEDGFIDGRGQRYNPSMIRVGVGQSSSVRAVSLENKVDAIFSEYMDAGQLQQSIESYKMEITRITQDISRLRRRLHAISTATPYPVSKDWEIRIDEDTFDQTGRVYFVNHKEKATTYEAPPPPEPGETQFSTTSMPEYRTFMERVVKLVENYFNVKTQIERATIVKGSMDAGANNFEMRLNLETHVLNSVHMVMTTLGTAGSRALEQADKFEVVVVDEAAQSVEPASLSALQLGSRHAVLVGDPQQLPATIFNVSGRNSKYDRSLFQRLEEAGQPVYMLNEQYRMHPKISHFPRHIFYQGALLDGPNVRQAEYGNPLRGLLCQSLPFFQPLMILDLDSREERGGTSLANSSEAKLAVFLYQQLKVHSRGLSASSKVAVITPYAQQSKLLKRVFGDILGPKYSDYVEINTVDAFQGREANIVIFSAVRAAGSRGIGFLSDVRRMNVALTRAKHFLFVICRCESVVVNPYWNDLVQHARETRAVVSVPILSGGFGGGVGRHHNRQNNNIAFGDLATWHVAEPPIPSDPRKRAAIGSGQQQHVARGGTM